MPNHENRYSRSERYYNDPYGERYMPGRSDDYYADQRREYDRREARDDEWPNDRSTRMRGRSDDGDDWGDRSRSFYGTRGDNYRAGYDESYPTGNMTRRDYRDEDDRRAMGAQRYSGQPRYGSSWTGSALSDMQSTGQYRGKGPKGYTRSDDRIREDVSDALMQDADLDASDIEVSVKKGEVTLQGQVDDRADKRRAEDYAEACAGVQNVQNNLKVRGSQSTTEAGRAETRP